MKRLTTMERWVTFVGIGASLLALMLAASGCAVRAKVYTNQEACCERLDVRLKEMEEFNRYCMMMVFADRKEDNPKVKEDIKRRLNLCKFVFGVPRDQDLMSHLQTMEVRPHSAWRQVYNVFCYHPVSCVPSEIHCEEF